MSLIKEIWQGIERKKRLHDNRERSKDFFKSQITDVLYDHINELADPTANLEEIPKPELTNPENFGMQLHFNRREIPYGKSLVWISNGLRLEASPIGQTEIFLTNGREWQNLEEHRRYVARIDRIREEFIVIPQNLSTMTLGAKIHFALEKSRPIMGF